MQLQPAQTTQPSSKSLSCITIVTIWLMSSLHPSTKKAPSMTRAIRRGSLASSKSSRLPPSALITITRRAGMTFLVKVLAATAIASQRTASLLKSSNSTAQATVETAQTDPRHKATTVKESLWETLMSYVVSGPPSLKESTKFRSEMASPQPAKIITWVKDFWPSPEV